MTGTGPVVRAAPPAPLAPPPAGVCDVWLMAVRRRAAWAEVLSDAERERLAGLPEGTAADTFLTSRAAQRLVAARYLGVPPAGLAIDRTCALCAAPGHGRPRVQGAPVDFSVSHTRDWLLLAVVGSGLVGADLDSLDPGRDADGLAAIALTAAERRDYERLPPDARRAAFLTSWVRKEAAMKLTGHGLAAAPGRIDVSGPLATAPAVPGWPTAPLHLTPLPAPPAHRAALATTTPVTTLRELTLPA